MRRLVLLLVLIAVRPAVAEQVTDAAGRVVTLPERIEHVLPAGPPAAVLLAAIAPDLTMGFTAPLMDAAKAALPDRLAALPTVPRLTAGQDLDGLKPDLIIDYGTVSQRYADLARDTQDKTGIPTLLFDGALDHIPAVAREIGRILHRTERAETVARVAEAILALPPPSDHPTVYYARGADGLQAAAPGTDITAVFTRLGWTVVAPPGTGTFRTTTLAELNRLDPDVIILADPAARPALDSAEWGALRAVQDGNAMVAPNIPFGWIEQPPSINRLLGLAWLSGGEATSLAALFNAAIYGKALTTEQVSTFATPSQP